MDGQVNDETTTLESALAQARERVKELFPELTDEDPKLSLGEIAQLLGVTYATTLQWTQRSKAEYAGPGKLDPAFPGPEPGSRPHAPERLLSRVVKWAYDSYRYPEPIGRPATRGSRAA